MPFTIRTFDNNRIAPIFLVITFRPRILIIIRSLNS